MYICSCGIQRGSLTVFLIYQKAIIDDVIGPWFIVVLSGIHCYWACGIRIFAGKSEAHLNERGFQRNVVLIHITLFPFDPYLHLVPLLYTSRSTYTWILEGRRGVHMVIPFGSFLRFFYWLVYLVL